MKKLLVLSVIGGMMMSTACKKDDESEIEGQWEVQSYEEKTEPEDANEGTYSSLYLNMTDGAFTFDFRTDPDVISTSGAMMALLETYVVMDGDTISEQSATIETTGVFEQDVEWEITSDGEIRLGTDEGSIVANYTLDGDNLRIWYDMISEMEGVSMVSSTDINLRKTN